MTKILILPGWQDSGPEHWQSLWLKKYPNAVKVEQKDWMNARKDDWVAGLNAAVEAAGEEVVLVGHSLGCLTIAHWTKTHPGSAKKVKGALLAAPGDADAADFPKEMSGFAPLPMQKLPFKSIIATSDNDKWVSLDRAKQFAEAWGSEIHIFPGKGHLNGASNLGDWPEGEKLLAQLL
jgi:predicted alpha/beta hydrolase family esterase